MSKNSVYYDPYSAEIFKNPYPTYKRLREEAPLYYNEKFDFYALSRYDDVRTGYKDHETFISGRSGILELIKQNVKMPPGTFIFEDPPLHTAHRAIVQRMFTPRRMNGLEPKVRELTIKCLDKIAASDEFDFIDDIGRQVPMRVIGMLLGIPETDLQMVREITDNKMRTEEGQAVNYDAGLEMEQSFGEYIDWRVKNPSDDILTELMQVEFNDETNTLRKLTREELITFFNVLAGAGNETTNRTIGWIAKTLAEHPDQRRELVQNPELIPQAIEEVLRFETPSPHVGRFVARDTVIQGQLVPAGNAILFLNASANHDERAFDNPEKFDIHRDRKNSHISFGYGIHTCIGNVLARMEARVVYEELLKRIPEWDIDMDNAYLMSTSTVRGWDKLPAYVNAKGAEKIKSRVAMEAQARAAKAASSPASIDGQWTVTVNVPGATMQNTLTVETIDGKLQAYQTDENGKTIIDKMTYDKESGEIFWSSTLTQPMEMTVTHLGSVSGNTISGELKTGAFGTFPFSATKNS